MGFQNKLNPPKSMNKKKLILTIIIGLIVLVLIVVVIQKNNNDQKIAEQQNQLAENENSLLNPVVPEETTGQEELAQPVQSDQSVTPAAEVPKVSLELNFSPEGLSPKEFTVKPGALVTLTVSCDDIIIHTFAFKDPSLANAIISVGPSDIRTITFNAPTKAGEYTYFCKVSGHSEVGTMIVK